MPLGGKSGAASILYMGKDLYFCRMVDRPTDQVNYIMDTR